jgi:allantoinase
VHVNEPGRTEWEGYHTATRAAAAGGITTLVDMPLNCIPVTTSLAALETKIKALDGKLHVDTGFYGGLIPGNAGELLPMVKRGVLGFKAFMVHSGIDDFPMATAPDIEAGKRILAKTRVPLLAHAELEAPLPAPLPPHATPEPYARYLASRPKDWEDAAIDLLIAKSRATGCRTHVVHLSSADAIPALRAARGAGVAISAETCPHYLTFTAEEIADGDTRFKCAPPIREAANRERLWAGLEDATVDFVVSDHSPCAPHLKHMERGDFEAAWGGIAGLQFGFAAVWTRARERGVTLAQMARWMSERPAALVGLTGRKGVIAPGADADLAVVDPDRRHTVTAAGVLHRHKVTPYAERTFAGVVEATFVRGRLVYERGAFPAEAQGSPLFGPA